jgi:GNAT superfamily N-acetyltransferase
MRPAPGVEVYREHPRSYRSTIALGVAIVAGAALDFALGGAGTHFWAWLAAFVLICGLDALAVNASQRLRSIAVTRDRLVVGEHSFERTQIEGVDVPADTGVAAIAPSPRGSTLVGVRVKGGGVLGVPTRKPEQLAGALGFRATPVLLEVREAETGDLPDLPELETRADMVFKVAGFGPLPPAADVASYAAAEALFVAGRPAVGVARVELVDGTAHLEQLAVLPSHMRRGVGTALLERVLSWAADNGHTAVTLCTFGDVAWNGPFYARSGFLELEPADWTPGLAELRRHEAELGLDAMGRRVVMRRDLMPE